MDKMIRVFENGEIKEYEESEVLDKVKNNVYYFYNILDQTEKLCMEALNIEPAIIHHVIDKTPKMIYRILDKFPQYVFTLDNLDRKMSSKLIKANPIYLDFLNQTEELCLEAVKLNGYALQYAINQTDKICLEAVKQNPWALKHVKVQTHDICLEAVKQDGAVIKYVKDQTDDICFTALKSNMKSIHFIRNKTDEMWISLLKQNGLFLSIINKENQTEKLIKVALEEDINNFKYVKDKEQYLYLLNKSIK